MFGMKQLTAKSLAGSMSSMCTVSVSPGSAPSTKIGPVRGLGLTPASALLGRSDSKLIRLPMASSVWMITLSPGRTVAVGSRCGLKV